MLSAPLTTLWRWGCHRTHLLPPHSRVAARRISRMVHSSHRQRRTHLRHIYLTINTLRANTLPHCCLYQSRMWFSYRDAGTVTAAARGCISTPQCRIGIIPQWRLVLAGRNLNKQAYRNSARATTPASLPRRAFSARRPYFNVHCYYSRPPCASYASINICGARGGWQTFAAFSQPSSACSDAALEGTRHRE